MMKKSFFLLALLCLFSTTKAFSQACPASYSSDVFVYGQAYLAEFLDPAITMTQVQAEALLRCNTARNSEILALTTACNTYCQQNGCTGVLTNNVGACVDSLPILSEDELENLQNVPFWEDDYATYAASGSIQCDCVQ